MPVLSLKWWRFWSVLGRLFFCFPLLAGAGFVGSAACALVMVWPSVSCVCLLLALVGFAVGRAIFLLFGLFAGCPGFICLLGPIFLFSSAELCGLGMCGVLARVCPCRLTVDMSI